MIFEDKSDVYFISFAFIILLFTVIFFVYSNKKVKGKLKENNAKLRKEKWRLIVNRRWAYSSLFMSFIMVFSTYLNYYLTNPVELTAAQPFQEEGGNIIIPLSDVDDGHLHRIHIKKTDTI